MNFMSTGAPAIASFFKGLVPAKIHDKTCAAITTNPYDLGWFAAYTGVDQSETEPAPHEPGFKDWWRGFNDGMKDKELSNSGRH